MSLPRRYCYWISPPTLLSWISCILSILSFKNYFKIYLLESLFKLRFDLIQTSKIWIPQHPKLMFADTVAELRAWPWVMNHSKNAVTLKILYKGPERWLRKMLLFWKNWVRFPAPTSGDSLITPAPDLQGHLQSHGIQRYRDTEINILLSKYFWFT